MSVLLRDGDWMTSIPVLGAVVLPASLIAGMVVATANVTRPGRVGSTSRHRGAMGETVPVFPACSSSGREVRGGRRVQGAGLKRTLSLKED
jgi:hypothetical protein